MSDHGHFPFTPAQDAAARGLAVRRAKQVRRERFTVVTVIVCATGVIVLLVAYYVFGWAP